MLVAGEHKNTTTLTVKSCLEWRADREHKSGVNTLMTSFLLMRVKWIHTHECSQQQDHIKETGRCFFKSSFRSSTVYEGAS